MIVFLCVHNLLEMCQFVQLTECEYDCIPHEKNLSLYICLVLSKPQGVHQKRKHHIS